MTATALDAHDLGVAIGSLLIPIIGLILLIIGLVERRRSARQSPPIPPEYQGPPQFGTPYPPPPTGYGPPPGYPPYMRPPGMPHPRPPGQWPPPNRKPVGTGLMIAGAAILGLSLVGGVVRVADSSSTSSERSTESGSRRINSGDRLTVGQCVADNEFGEGAPKPIACDNVVATMELASQGGADADCPDGKGHEDTDYTTLFWNNATMCFIANLTVPNCYAVDTNPTSGAPFTFESCTDPRATVKVVKRFDGTTDAARCPSGTKPISYPEPAPLYCFSPAG